MTEYEFVVIGGGIAGASIAYFLSKAARVLIVEAESQPGYHATGRSAAVYSEIYGNATIRALTVGSRGFLKSPPDGFTETPLLYPRPTIMVGRGDQGQKLDNLYEQVRQLAPAVKRLNAKEARAALFML